MTDDLVIRSFVLIFLDKIRGTGERDAVNILLHLVRRHAQSVIDHLDRLVLRAHNDLDLCLVIIRQGILSHHIQLLQFGDGVAPIADQLAIKDIMIRIQPFFNDRKQIFAVDR